MMQLCHTHHLIENKKSDKTSSDKIDLLINNIINGKGLHKSVIKGKSTNSFDTWIMPEEPKGFIKFKKHDPL